MMKNITMGQYYPVDSWVHRLDPRTKILLTIAMIVAVFLVKTMVGYALILGFMYLTSRLSNIPFKMLLKGVKPLRFILILTFLLNEGYLVDVAIIYAMLSFLAVVLLTKICMGVYHEKNHRQEGKKDA